MKLFKGDDNELKVIAAVEPVFDFCSLTLDEMYAGASSSDSFLLMLYDLGRMPYSQRIKRDSFVGFYRQVLEVFEATGTFEAYLFILRGIFGINTEIFFASASPGTLEITLNIENELGFDFIGRTLNADLTETTFEMITQDEEVLQFRGLSGFDSDRDIELLFSELMPMGIIPTFLINFYDYSYFIAYDSLGTYGVIDESDNQIVFYEIGA